MIDIESEVYTPIAEALRTAFPGIDVSGEYAKAPTSLPHVSIVERDNYTPKEYLDTSDTEQYAALMYEVTVYSDKAQGKKTECRKIMGKVDEMMYARNFRRTTLTPVPNLENASIYRLLARFEAVTDGTTIYRR